MGHKIWPSQVKLSLAAFAFGCIYDWVLVTYLKAVDAHLALQAGIVSLELGFLGIGSLWAWDMSGRKFRVLAAEAIGMAAGSYLAVRWWRP